MVFSVNLHDLLSKIVSHLLYGLVSDLRVPQIILPANSIYNSIGSNNTSFIHQMIHHEKKVFYSSLCIFQFILYYMYLYCIGCSVPTHRKLISNKCVFSGNPIMIVTEYMENGALDAFLRVSTS